MYNSIHVLQYTLYTIHVQQYTCTTAVYMYYLNHENYSHENYSQILKSDYNFRRP